MIPQYLFKNILLCSQAYIRQTRYVVMLSKEGSTKIVSFMTPGVGVLVQGHINRIVKMHYFFLKSFSLLFQAQIRQTKYIVIVTKEGTTKIVNFICHYSEQALFSSLSIYFRRIMMLLSYTIVDFHHLIYYGAVNMQMCALLKNSQCKFSDSQVNFKACWPLVD